MAVIALFILFGCKGEANATPSCGIYSQPINFGSIDVTTGSAVDTTSSVTIYCSGTAGETVRACLELGAGSGGISSSTGYRQMASGTSILMFNLYKNPAKTEVWGSELSNAPGTALEFTINLLGGGRGSTTLPVTATIPANQKDAAVGSYNSGFSGNDYYIRYGYGSTEDCNSINEAKLTGGFLQVSASVENRCTVGATDLNFGNVGIIDSHIDATNKIFVSCTSGTFFTLGLNGGIAFSFDPAERLMQSIDGAIRYGLFTDINRNFAWGDGYVGTMQSGSGTGDTQTYLVYGRVYEQETPPPGIYSDTIVISVNY